MYRIEGLRPEPFQELFGQPEISTIDAHNAAYGCFAARIERT